MPRTNARVWPKANPTENEIWLDAAPPPRIPRDQWLIPGNSNPLPHSNPTHPNYYHPQAACQQPHYQQPPPANYPQPTTTGQAAPWMSLAQYNGHPAQIGKLTTPTHNSSVVRQVWTDSKEQNGNTTYPEVAKQELWVDGPTAFRKNIEGLTDNLRKEQPAPAKKYHQ